MDRFSPVIQAGAVKPQRIVPKESQITELDKARDTAVGSIASGKHSFNAVCQFVSRTQKSTRLNDFMLGNSSRS
jgi:hypothetical protein